MNDQAHEVMRDSGELILGRIRQRINEYKQSIEDVRSQDDGLVDRLDVKTEELDRLSQIFDVLANSRYRVKVGMADSGIMNIEAQKIHIPGERMHGYVAWHESPDQDIQAVIDRMKELVEEIDPDRQAYNGNRARIVAWRQLIDKLRAEEQSIKEIVDPFRML